MYECACVYIKKSSLSKSFRMSYALINYHSSEIRKLFKVRLNISHIPKPELFNSIQHNLTRRKPPRINKTQTPKHPQLKHQKENANTQIRSRNRRLFQVRVAPRICDRHQFMGFRYRYNGHGVVVFVVAIAQVGR